MGASAHTSVFEGINAYIHASSGDLFVFRLVDHLRRLIDSMRLMRMPLQVSVEDLARNTVELLRANQTAEDTYIRPVAFYSGLHHVSFPDTLGAEPELLIWTRPFQSVLDAPLVRHLGVVSWARIADNVMPARIKAMSNYPPPVAAGPRCGGPAAQFASCLISLSCCYTGLEGSTWRKSSTAVHQQPPPVLGPISVLPVSSPRQADPAEPAVRSDFL